MNRVCSAILCLVLAVELPLGVGEGAVICFGADGHVAIEVEGAGCCAGVPERARSARESVFDVADHAGHEGCGPCLDIPTVRVDPARPVTVSPSNVGPSGAPAECVCGVAEPLTSPVQDGLRSTPEEPVPPPRLAALRTQILLV
jgi:hypothetical protein